MTPKLFLYLEKLSAPVAQPQHQEFLDEHFSISPNWKKFRSKLKSKSFVEAVKQDTRTNDKLKRYSEANGKHLSDKGVPTFTVPSLSVTKKYTVKYHPDDDRFSCNCGDWIHKRSWQEKRESKDCKHIHIVKERLEKHGIRGEELTKQAARGRAALKLLKVGTTSAP